MTAEYIAGFIDGEGTITTSKNKIRITIPQTNFEVLNEIQKYLGIGKILKEKKRQTHWKDSWVFYTTNSKDSYNILLNIKDFLIVKKNKAFEAITIYESWVERLKLRDLETSKILALVDKGMSYREIQKIFKINRQKVYRAVKTRV